MILTCPACATRYQADEAKFPAEGRTVRCAKCGHSWHEAAPVPAAAEAEILSPSEALAEPAPAPSAPPSGTRAYAPAAQVHAGATARKGVGLQSFGLGLGWIGLVAIVLLIGYAAVKYRQDVAAIWPQSASVYSGLGMKVNVNGIDFRGVSYKRGIEDGQPVLEVTGSIVNAASRELPLPQAIRVTLSDGDNRELYHWVFKPAAETLKAGQAIPFRTRLASPPAAARHLEVRFVKDGS